MGVLRLKVGGTYTDVVQGPAGPMGPQGIQGATGPAGSDAPSKVDIISNIVLAATATQIDFTGLSNTTYPTMKLMISTPAFATSAVPRLRFNGITTSTYQFGYSYSGYAGSSNSGQAGIIIEAAGNSTPLSADITIDAKTARAFGMSIAYYGQGNSFWGEQSTNPAVTSISLYRDGAAVWPIGSRFALYGFKVA